ncbi:hypothetical protein ES708_27882 [subsurface metagenome]
MKEKECEHQKLMEMKVVETRKTDMIVIRLRECGTCGSKVKTEERMSGLIAKERVNNEMRMGRTEREMIAARTDLMVVINALKILQRVTERSDGEKRAGG